MIERLCEMPVQLQLPVIFGFRPLVSFPFIASRLAASRPEIDRSMRLENDRSLLKNPWMDELLILGTRPSRSNFC
jgi:hypothetical protein